MLDDFTAMKNKQLGIPRSSVSPTESNFSEMSIMTTTYKLNVAISQLLEKKLCYISNGKDNL